MALLLCPLCGSTSLERLIGPSVVAYQCLENAHIFFVRKTEFEASEPIRAEVSTNGAKWWHSQAA